MPRRSLFAWLLAVLILATGALPVTRTTAQSDPDAWTNTYLNMRAAPSSPTILTVLPPDTALLVEAHAGEQTWLLVRTLDDAWRGWVASGYLRYRDGFAAYELPTSEETIPAPANAAPPQAAESASDASVAPASGLIESMTLIHSTPRSEYYAITYLSDGLRINGYLGYPTGDGPFPAVIFNRGGAWDSGALSGNELVPLVESGYVAIASQYRGCGGSEGLETFGWDDVNDVLNLIPILDSLPQVDGSRIGMMGGSRGGMMTYLALKEDTLRGTHRIRAAVTVGGISDLFLWAEQNPELTEDIYMAVIGAMPDQNPDPYIHRSAVFWPELINAPLLLMHGEADWVVPVEQSQRLYAALQQHGRIVGLVIYPGDDHPLTGQFGGYPEAQRFFQQHLGGDGSDRLFESHREAIDEVIRWFWLNR